MTPVSARLIAIDGARKAPHEFIHQIGAAKELFDHALDKGVKSHRLRTR